MGFKKGQRRNEALDIFVYSFVTLKILNANFRIFGKEPYEGRSKNIEDGQ